MSVSSSLTDSSLFGGDSSSSSSSAAAALTSYYSLHPRPCISASLWLVCVISAVSLRLSNIDKDKFYSSMTEYLLVVGKTRRLRISP